MPIHRDAQIDLKTEKGGVVKGHNKKRRKEKTKKKKETKCQKQRNESVKGNC